jgi:hypothetical protein
VRQIELLHYVIEVLEQQQIAYAIVGSLASGTWGEPRMTRDIDIVIQLPAEKIDALCSAFPEDDFYVSQAAATEAVQRCGQFNVIHPSSGNKVDFMIAAPSGWTSAQLARRKRVDFGTGTAGYIAAPEDVILGKLLYYREGGSEKHLRDITGILATAQDAVDREYIAQFATPLGVAELWQTLLRRLDENKPTD